MSDDKKTVERFTLLPNRYYIILEKVDEEQFTLSAYDTTKVDNPDAIPCAAQVVQEGLLESLDRNFDNVVGLGVARMELSKGLEHQGTPNDNVIKIDFGDKQ
jgi:hypothetical protein